MSIEVRIPKEIKEYKEKIIFGLSLRQLISVFIGGIICLSTYFLTKPIVGSEMASDIIIIEAIPIFAFGFIKVRSFDFEVFAKIFIKYKLSKHKRTYENKLNIELIKNEYKSVDSKKEVRKVENNKDQGETKGYERIGRTAKIKEIRARIKRAKKEFKEETKRTETAEIDQTKEQLKIAKRKYQKARKRKGKKDKTRKGETNNTKHDKV